MAIIYEIKELILLFKVTTTATAKEQNKQQRFFHA